MTNCTWCGEKVEASLPYQCNECGHNFCAQHRLPETHQCRELSSDNLRFGNQHSDPKADRNDEIDPDYETIEPLTYGSPIEDDIETGPDLTKTGDIKGHPEAAEEPENLNENNTGALAAYSKKLFRMTIGRIW